MTLDDIRAGIPALARLAYLNAGTFGPLATATMDAVARESRRDLEEGRAGADWYAHVTALRQAAREAIARLVGTSADRVAITASTTDGCAVVVSGLGLGPDDEVITTTDEHFGLLGALGACPARVVVVEPSLDPILAAVTPRTRLIALSQVLWTTGGVLPVSEIRERSGIPLLVDGAQSVGMIPVDATTVDYLTVSGQKWLCGPDATGALVVRDPDSLAVSRPSYFSQQAYEPDGRFTPRNGAERFELNWMSAGALAGLRTAIESRPPWAFEHPVAQAAVLRTSLASHVDVVEPEHPSTIVSFRPRREEPSAAVARLQGQGVIVREIPRTGLVRASVGWWTSDEDIERLVRGIAG